jgi:iron-sulfur cluster repair protein YtfE (RIC family)
MTHGPIRALRFVHNAISAQAKLVEERAYSADGFEQARALAPEVHILTDILRGHIKGEDDGYFCTLAERAPNSVEAFTFDHREESARLDEIDRLVDACSSNDDVVALRRAVTVLREQVDHHMKKEEEILWPLTESLFSPPEQGQIIQAILSVIPKEAMPKLVPWIVSMQSPQDAVAYVQVLERAQPPEVFAMSKRWIESGVSSERWSELVGALPSLQS